MEAFPFVSGRVCSISNVDEAKREGVCHEHVGVKRLFSFRKTIRLSASPLRLRACRDSTPTDLVIRSKFKSLWNPPRSRSRQSN
ncbi:hypothetical protein CEXT_589501 [Caerostris extrusa]|uniref:Uncharacterized protein n=1 Tax=Caerostris extrusa TaxID=172846 RepID=A0AAV4QBK9_CAEEX|nr:hypothetical protein CEXT_589501 [Caerostris extrusa]